MHRVGGERVADRVPNPLGEKRPDTGRPLDQPCRRGPRLGDAEVERVIECFRGEPVGLDHDRDGRRLDGDLHVVEAHLFEVGEFHAGRLDESLRRGTTEALVKLGVQGAGVDADADRDTTVASLRSDELYLLRFAQVAGIEA